MKPDYLMILISSAFSKTRLLPEPWQVLSCGSCASTSCIPAFSTRGKGALGPLLSASAGATKRETPTSNLIESTGLVVVLFVYHASRVSFLFSDLLEKNEATVVAGYGFCNCPRRVLAQRPKPEEAP